MSTRASERAGEPAVRQPLSEEWRETVKTASRAELQLPDFLPKGLLFKLSPEGRLQAQAPLEVEPLITLVGEPGGFDWPGDVNTPDTADAVSSNSDAGPQGSATADQGGPAGSDGGHG